MVRRRCGVQSPGHGRREPGHRDATRETKCAGPARRVRRPMAPGARALRNRRASPDATGAMVGTTDAGSHWTAGLGMRLHRTRATLRQWPGPTNQLSFGGRRDGLVGSIRGSPQQRAGRPEGGSAGFGNPAGVGEQMGNRPAAESLGPGVPRGIAAGPGFAHASGRSGRRGEMADAGDLKFDFWGFLGVSLGCISCAF